MNGTEARHLTDADRRDALYARHPSSYHFGDEEPEPRAILPMAMTHHVHDGFCFECKGHQYAGTICPHRA